MKKVIFFSIAMIFSAQAAFAGDLYEVEDMDDLDDVQTVIGSMVGSAISNAVGSSDSFYAAESNGDQNRIESGNVSNKGNSVAVSGATNASAASIAAVAKLSDAGNYVFNE